MGCSVSRDWLGVLGCMVPGLRHWERLMLGEVWQNLKEAQAATRAASAAENATATAVSAVITRSNDKSKGPGSRSRCGRCNEVAKDGNSSNDSSSNLQHS